MPGFPLRDSAGFCIPAVADFSFVPSGICTFDFMDESTPSVRECEVSEIVEWLWDFGDGTNSTSQNPNKTYSTPASYLVTLTVTDTAGCEDSVSINVSCNCENVKFAGIDIAISGVAAGDCTGLCTELNGNYVWSPASPMSFTPPIALTTLISAGGLCTVVGQPRSALVQIQISCENNPLRFTITVTGTLCNCTGIGVDSVVWQETVLFGITTGTLPNISGGPTCNWPASISFSDLLIVAA